MAQTAPPPHGTTLKLVDGSVLLPDGVVHHNLAIGMDADSGLITAIGAPSSIDADQTIACHGLTLLPGVIDSQVHFRDPGFPHKEDLGSGTLAAVKGGVTAIFEMPNTDPPTVDAYQLEQKFVTARRTAHCDYAFFIGGTPDNATELAVLEGLDGAVGVKIFMGSSTGGLLIDDDQTLRLCMAHGRRRVAIHAEDESMLRAQTDRIVAGDPSSHPLWRDAATALRATERLIRIATECQRPAHLLHITTSQEMNLLGNHKKHQSQPANGEGDGLITVEVTPQHLTLSAETAYQRLGTFAQMNPPIRGRDHQDALWQGVTAGVVDVIASDHAPHTIEEKNRPYPQSPSGMPGVQTMVPVMLNHVHEGRLSLPHLSRLWSTNPARLYGATQLGGLQVGGRANITAVDLGHHYRLEREWFASRCGWSPFNGYEGYGFPMMTVVGGQVVMRDGEVLLTPSTATHPAQKVRFAA
ncbi:MAG: dihydroorotase [Alphaproteobacteria bacterium]|nr:dihydroorotase [Alphaproteobacteria bacterium]